MGWCLLLLAMLSAARAEPLPGRVVDAAGRPAAGVLVCGALWSAGVASPEAGAPVTSDAEGRFTLSLPAAVGPYQPRLAVAVAAGRGCAVAAIAARATWLELRLEPGEEADGQVLDTALRPVAGARISLAGLSRDSVYVGLPDVGDRLWPARTGADGRWRLTDLPRAWRRHLSVRADGYAGAGIEVGAGFQPSPAAMAVLAPGGGLRGRVFGPAGQPLLGVRLWAGGQAARTREDGAYRFDCLPLGPATLRLSGELDQPGWAEPLATPTIAAGTVAEADLRLSPTVTLSGQLREADGTPAGGVYVVARRAQRTARQATSDAQGRFALRVLPGQYAVRVLGLRQPEPVSVTVALGEEPAPLAFELPPPPRLRLVDGAAAPVANAALRVAPEWLTGRHAAALATDARGEAALPSSVDLHDTDLLVCRTEPWLVGRYKPDRTGLTVELRMTAPATSPLSGRVTTPAGQALAGARVTLSLQARPDDHVRAELGDCLTTASDARGEFAFAAVPSAWRASVRAELAGHRGGAPVVLEPGRERLTTNLVLMPTTQVAAGTVVDAAGQPVVGAMVFAADYVVDRPAISGADGSFRCPDLPARPVTLLALRGQREVARVVSTPPADGLRLVLAEAPRLSWADAPSDADRDLAHDLLVEALATDPLARPLAVLARLDSTEALDHIARLPAGEAADALLQLLTDAPAEVRFGDALLSLLAAQPAEVRGLLAALASRHVAADQANLRRRLLAMVQAARQPRDTSEEALLYDLAAAALARRDDAPAAQAALRSAQARLAKGAEAPRDLVEVLGGLDLDRTQLEAILPALADAGQRAAVRAAVVLRTLRGDARAAWTLARAWWPGAEGGVSPPAGHEEGGLYPAWIKGRLALGLLATDPARARAMLAAERYDAGGFQRLLEAALTTTDAGLARAFLADAERCYPADEGVGDRLALAADGLDDAAAQRCRARALSSFGDGADRPYSLAATDPNRARWALESDFATNLAQGDDCGELAIAMAAVDLPRAAEMARVCRAEEEARTALACWLLAARPARATLPLSSWLGSAAAPEQEPLGD